MARSNVNKANLSPAEAGARLSLAKMFLSLKLILSPDPLWVQIPFVIPMPIVGPKIYVDTEKLVNSQKFANKKNVWLKNICQC